MLSIEPISSYLIAANNILKNLRSVNNSYSAPRMCGCAVFYLTKKWV